MKEEWKDIKGYEGLYQISNLGRIKSLKNNKGNYREKIRNSNPGKDGYIRINLYSNHKSKPFYIHRLVAEYFIPNTNNYKEINHKDENKSNNRVDNLEWCDRKYNINYGTRAQKFSEKMKGKNKGSKHPSSRKVQCITTGKKFDSIKEAGEYYKIFPNNISYCCQGKYRYAGKHPITKEKLKWKYID